ncbi:MULTISPECIES: pantocin A family RiPP [unclassified Morganella (in: enterobacteria)]|nr:MULTISPECIES: pantocin A family RiPP [unclassified Morganella (in: enterobacteria)]
MENEVIFTDLEERVSSISEEIAMYTEEQLIELE